MRKTDNKSQNYGLISIIFGGLSFLCIGFLYPALITIPVGLISGIVAFKKGFGKAGLVLSCIALVCFLAYWIFWYLFSKSFE